MSVVPLIGHDAVRERLLARIREQALPASLLLHGPRGVGKQRLALWLAQAMLCDVARANGSAPCGTCSHCRLAERWEHPDILWVFPRPRLSDGDAKPEAVLQDLAEGVAERRGKKGHGLYAPPAGTDGIYVATVRAVLRGMAPAPALARHRVLVVGDAERMVPQEGSDQAANAFLKLLEEPPASTTIVLTSSEPGALLPTIRSRVVAVRVAPLPAGEMRRFLAQEPVAEALAALGKAGMPVDEERRLALAGGAPGALFAATSRAAAFRDAAALVESVDAGAAQRYRTAFARGAAGARGAFSDLLDATTDLLAAQAREAAAVAPRVALRAATGAGAVERAKERANQNAIPQLVTARLLRDLAEGRA
jgi:DNA polymerase-3 subunit delta'